MCSGELKNPRSVITLGACWPYCQGNYDPVMEIVYLWVVGASKPHSRGLRAVGHLRTIFQMGAYGLRFDTIKWKFTLRRKACEDHTRVRLTDLSIDTKARHL